MPTILLEQIIELLTGWKDSFFTWANGIGDKIASIKTNTDSLPDIQADTDDIKDNTAAVITPISNINTNVSSISSDTASIRTDTGIIKNNAVSIATSSGAAAAFAEDVANNTLEVKNKVVTIASDTTQMRADSGSIRADVSEIKNTLGLYLYNTIVTEDAEGAIANFDTDLQDYLQNAVVTIPADAGGIAGITIKECEANIWDEDWINGYLSSSNGSLIVSGNSICSSDFNKIVPNIQIFGAKSTAQAVYIYYYDSAKNYINRALIENTVKTTPVNAAYFKISCYSYGSTYNNDISINYPATVTAYKAYNANTQSVSFTAPITDGAEVDLLSGIVKINTSPITYDSITPLAIRTFKGVNNIYSDIGNITVTYRETLKHYLEKQDANSRSLNRNVNLLRENISSTEDIIDDSDRRI